MPGMTSPAVAKPVDLETLGLQIPVRIPCRLGDLPPATDCAELPIHVALHMCCDRASPCCEELSPG